MALSGSTGSNVGSYWRLELDWSATQNIGGNYSDVSVSLYWVSTRSTSGVSSSATKSGYIIIDGTRTNFTATAGLSGNQRKRIATASKRVSHGSDGAKSFSISANFGMAVTLSGTYYGSRTISGTWSLNTIPRKTGVSLGNSTANFGSSIRINFDRKSSSFTHTVSFSFGGRSEVLWDKITWSNADWNVPVGLMSEIPNATSGWGNIHVDTYNGSTNLGRNSVRFTLNVPSNINPSFTSLTASETNSTVSNAGIGAYVQGMSNVKLTINGASGTYGSTIKSYSINFDGQVKGNNGVWSPSFSGSKTATATITDSRGRKTSKSISIAVISYSPPNISDVSVSRTGTAQTTATVFRSGSLSSLNGKNQVTIKVDSKLKDTSTWGNETSSTGAVGGTSFSATVTLPGTYDKTKSYDIRIRAIDKFNTVTTLASLSSAFSTLSLARNGVGIGKLWERGSIDMAGDVYSEGKLYAYGGLEIAGSSWASDQGEGFRGVQLNNSDIMGANGIFFNDLSQPDNFEGLMFPRTGALPNSTNKADYDNLFMNNGDIILNGVRTGDVLWAGEAYMHGSHKFFPSKHLDECPNGWVLVWGGYANGASTNYDWHYSFVHKSHAKRHNGAGVIFVIAPEANANLFGSKYVYVNNEFLEGYSSNSSGNEQRLVLREVLAW